MALLPCPRCGKIQEAKTGKKYCDDCRIIVRREQKAEAARTFRKAHPNKIKEWEEARRKKRARPAREKICVRCGSPFLTKTKQKYCLACAAVVAKEQRQAAAKRYIENNPERVKELSHLRSSLRWNDPAYRDEAKKRIEAARDKNMFGGHIADVYALYGGKCAACGSTKNLDIHHKDGKGSTVPQEQKNNSLDNLILLCRSCHRKVHNLEERYR